MRAHSWHLICPVTFGWLLAGGCLAPVGAGHGEIVGSPCAAAATAELVVAQLNPSIVLLAKPPFLSASDAKGETVCYVTEGDYTGWSLNRLGLAGDGGVSLLEVAASPVSSPSEYGPPLLAVGQFVAGGVQSAIWLKSDPDGGLFLAQPLSDGGTAVFVLPPAPISGWRPDSVQSDSCAAADLNGDGIDDFIEEYLNDDKSFSEITYLGNGHGTFVVGPARQIVETSHSVVGHWLDIPGSQLLLFTSEGAEIFAVAADGGLFVTPVNGNAAFWGTGQNFSHLWSSDLNGDGLDELVGGPGLQVFWNQGGGVFTPGRKLRGSNTAEPLNPNGGARMAFGHFTTLDEPQAAVLTWGMPPGECHVDPPGHVPDLTGMECTGIYWAGLGELSILTFQADAGFCLAQSLDLGFVSIYDATFLPAALDDSGYDSLAISLYGDAGPFLMGPTEVGVISAVR